MLISLERQAGLPLLFNPDDNTIKFEDGVSAEKSGVRTIAEMKEYIAEPQAAVKSDPIYFVYRSVARSEDRGKIRSVALRYDLTVIPPGHFVDGRKEFFRTAGHYHPVKPGTNTAFPEVFEVITGRVYWLLQKPEAGDPSKIGEIFAVEAGPGDKAVILPGFGHMSVNAFSEPLIMANWVSTEFAYHYGPYKNLRGSAYWMIEGSVPTTIEFKRNKNYAEVPELKKLRPREISELGLLRSKPLYFLAEELDKLDFLSSPERFAHLLTIDRCYQKAI